MPLQALQQKHPAWKISSKFIPEMAATLGSCTISGGCMTLPFPSVWTNHFVRFFIFHASNDYGVFDLLDL